MISMKVVISLVVIAVAWIVLLVIHLYLRRNNKNSAPALSVTTENPAALAHDPTPQVVQVVLEEKRESQHDLPATPRVEEDSEEEKFKKGLRELRAGGLDSASSVAKIWDEYGGTLESEEVLDALVELGYEAAEVVPVLLSRGYHLPEIFTLIDERYNPGAGEWLDLLWPVVPSDIVSIKAGKILDAFRERTGDSSLEWSDFVEPLLKRGLRQMEFPCPF